MTRYIAPVILLVIASAVQGNLPGGMTILGAKPDLVLVVLIAYSLAEDPAFGATLGFIAGLVSGCSVGMGLGSLIATRTVTGFLAGLVSARLFSANALVPMLSAVWLTAACGALFQLVNPRVGFPIAVRLIAGECIQNAIFTFVFYYMLAFFNTRRKIKLANARL